MAMPGVVAVLYNEYHFIGVQYTGTVIVNTGAPELHYETATKWAPLFEVSIKETILNKHWASLELLLFECEM